MIRIVVRKGGLAGKSFEFRRDSIHIGRADGNDLVLPDEWISSHHARIAISGERYILQDLRSTNGTFMVYGETRTRLEQGQTQELLADNTVQFGSKDSIVEMSIQVIEDDDRDGARIVSIRRIDEVRGVPVESFSERIRALFEAQTKVATPVELDEVIEAVTTNVPWPIGLVV